jgi:hypothetical protein
MSIEKTPNYNLNKPGYDNFGDVADLNENADIIDAALQGKVDKEAGKGLSEANFTASEKSKLAGIQAGAQPNAVTSVAGKTGAVTLDKTNVGLGNVDNTADANKEVLSATKLTTARKIEGVTFDGTQDISLPVATTSAKGLMSAADKTKLNNIEANATNNVKATQTEAEEGIDDTKYMTPLKTKQAIYNSIGTVFGVEIDLTNSNPETAVTYTDGAVGMNPGSAWDTMPIFKDIKPCMLKNGVVQYYLNPADLTKKADGTAADITSGNDGDVMIEIPKTGYKIITANNTLIIKVTSNPDDAANFKYYAHTRVTEGDRSKLYIGAYLGHETGSKLRSISGKAPTASKKIGEFRTLAKANGAGYDIVSFYPLTLLQCLFMIKYKNRDSQTALGRGYVDGNSAAINTGGTNSKGIDFGETTGKQQMCFLNIEDMWGNLFWFIDGLFSNASRNMLTAFTDFNDTGAGYTDRGQGATSDIGNYMSKPQGTTETGFIAKEVSGSATTHFADIAYLNASRLPDFGGYWDIGGHAGVFRLVVYLAADYSASNFGARLMYL